MIRSSYPYANSIYVSELKIDLVHILYTFHKNNIYQLISTCRPFAISCIVRITSSDVSSKGQVYIYHINASSSISMLLLYSCINDCPLCFYSFCHRKITFHASSHSFFWNRGATFFLLISSTR